MHRIITIIGVILYAGPLVGLAGTVIGMLSAFDSMGLDGVANQEELATSIRFALYSTIIGIVSGLLGTILVLVSIFSFRYRAGWFFGLTVFLSLLWGLWIFPYGLIVGLPIGILFLWKSREFFPGSKAEGTNPVDAHDDFG